MGVVDVVVQEQPVHVLTAVLKAFLREMPQPLLTYERYDQFLRAADIADEKERVSFLMALTQQLPAAHFDLLERLVFHLTRVALNEKSNRMSANALAIVFAPCILRTSRLQQVHHPPIQLFSFLVSHPVVAFEQGRTSAASISFRQVFSTSFGLMLSVWKLVRLG